MISFSRFRVARLAMLTTVAVGTTLGSACVQDQDYLIVERAVWFPDGENCVLSSGDDSPLAMTADVYFDTRIGMGFVITNNQSPNVNSNTGIDDSEIKIETAEVKLSFSAGGLSESSFEFTLPSNSILGGEQDVQLIQLPATVAQSIRETMQGLPPTGYETLEMEVVFKGRRTGQVGNSKIGSVKTRAFTYPIEVCYGCLATCCDDLGTMCPSETDWGGGTCGFAQGAAITYGFACPTP